MDGAVASAEECVAAAAAIEVNSNAPAHPMRLHPAIYRLSS